MKGLGCFLTGLMSRAWSANTFGKRSFVTSVYNSLHGGVESYSGGQKSNWKQRIVISAVALPVLLLIRSTLDGTSTCTRVKTSNPVRVS